MSAPMRVLVTGATGFLGSSLVERLLAGGHRIVVLSRSPDSARERLGGGVDAYPWRPLQEQPPAEALHGVDAVVHLAGESVVGRWTEGKRQAIRDSRVIGTRNLVAAIKAAESPPGVLVSGSAIGYYGPRGDEELSELSAPGDDFLAEVCEAWEDQARAAKQAGARVVRLRTGIVLGRGGGALDRMVLPAKLGLNGPLGNGKQWWSWIHIDDWVGIVERALTSADSGAMNATSPQPERQKDFARTLGRVLHRPAFLPTPAFVLKIVLGGFSTELLGSKKVLPTATRAAGYTFAFPDLESALRDLLA